MKHLALGLPLIAFASLVAACSSAPSAEPTSTSSAASTRPDPRLGAPPPLIVPRGIALVAAPRVAAPAWSLDRATRDAALTADGSLAAIGANELFKVDSSGALISASPLADFDAELAALETLDVPAGALDGVAIAGGEVAVTDATHTYVRSTVDCPTPVAWDVPVAGLAARFASNGDVIVIGVDGITRTVTRLAAADGAVVWRTTLDPSIAPWRTTFATLTALEVDAAGDVFAAGYRAKIPPTGEVTIWTSTVAKLAPDGSIAWRMDEDLVTLDSIAVTASGEVTFAARTRWDGPNGDLVVDRLDAAGNTVFEWRPPRNLPVELGQRLADAGHVAVDASGRTYVTASEDEGGPGTDGTLTLALDASGATAWYAYASGDAYAIAVGGGRVFVARNVGVVAYDAP